MIPCLSHQQVLVSIDELLYAMKAKPQQVLVNINGFVPMKLRLEPAEPVVLNETNLSRTQTNLNVLQYSALLSPLVGRFGSPTEIDYREVPLIVWGLLGLPLPSLSAAP